MDANNKINIILTEKAVKKLQKMKIKLIEEGMKNPSDTNVINKILECLN